MTDSELIDKLGGPAQLARNLGLGKYGTQRVHNWRTRGIPAKVKLEHLHLFLLGITTPTAPKARKARK